jgi:hypothetical protein
MAVENEDFKRGLTPPIPQYYRVGAVAARLGLSEKSVVRRLANDPDVLVMTEKKRGTRRYQTYLIPECSIHRLIGGLKPRGSQTARPFPGALVAREPTRSSVPTSF